MGTQGRIVENEQLTKTLFDTITLDPGLRCTGWALWVHGRLVKCGASRSDAKDLGEAAHQHALNIHLATYLSHPSPALGNVVLERMQDRGNKTKRVRDILDCQAVGSYVAGWMRPKRIIYRSPREWKGGNIPKQVNHWRMIDLLYPEELEVIEQTTLTMAKTIQHNLLDAVAIGVGHFERRMVEV